MKNRKQIFTVFMLSLLILNFSNSFPNVIAPRPATSPDQFIGEIFPNSTLGLQLIRTKTLITINATDFYNKIDINFDSNYTIYNPDYETTIQFIVPFSFATNITNFNFEIHANNIQVPYNLYNTTPWNENITDIDIHFLSGSEVYPIILIISNVVLPENSTSVIRYQITGLSTPFNSKKKFFMAYYLGTSQEWIGNKTGRIEIKLYAKQPVIFKGTCPEMMCISNSLNEGQFTVCKWNNIQNPPAYIYIGFNYEILGGQTFDLSREIIISISILGLILILTLLLFLLRKRRINIKRTS